MPRGNLKKSPWKEVLSGWIRVCLFDSGDYDHALHASCPSPPLLQSVVVAAGHADKTCIRVRGKSPLFRGHGPKVP